MHTGNYDELGRRPIHPFPARMAPSIAFAALRDQTEQITVLDPMVGSGVVPAIAGSVGHRAVGVDVDPLAVLISKVWNRPLEREVFEELAAAVLAEGRARFDSVPDDAAFPDGADPETTRFVEFWFDLAARKQLLALSRAIGAVPEQPIRDVLWCVLSRLIISKQSGASLAMDLSHGRPHRAFAAAPTLPFSGFARAARVVADNTIEQGDTASAPEVDVRLGDARALWLADSTVDMVLTSPPYLNAIDYIRCSKFSLVWMGYSIRELRSIRSSSVGTEVGDYGSDGSRLSELLSALGLGRELPARQQAILARYIGDLGKIAAEAARVLRPGGQAVFVVGENTVRGFFIRNSRILELVAAEAGLKCVAAAARDLPPSRRYLPPPTPSDGRSRMARRMRREVVMTFENEGA